MTVALCRMEIQEAKIRSSSTTSSSSSSSSYIWNGKVKDGVTAK